MGDFGFVRAKPLDYGGLKKAEGHALGLDVTSQRRRRKDAGPRASAWMFGPDGMQGKLAAEVGEVSHLTRGFADFKKAHGIGERKGSASCLHLLVGVSPGVLKGDPSQPDNADGQKLLRAAYEWAESEFGDGVKPCVFAVRRDLDERGHAVVDVLVAPSRMLGAGKGRKKRQISVRKALNEAADRWERPRSQSYSALQDGWAAHVRKVFPSVERGRSKRETAREHIHADVYADTAAAVRAQARAQVEAEKARALGEIAAAKPALLQRARAEIVAQAQEEANAIKADIQSLLVEARELLGKS